MPSDVESVIKSSETYMQHKAANSPPRGYEVYHPSAAGKCLRLMQYQRYAERGYIPNSESLHDPNLLRIFDNGHWMHERWTSYFEGIGVLRGYWNCKNPLCGAFNNMGKIKSNFKEEHFKRLLKNPKLSKKLRRKFGSDELQGSFKPKECICGSRDFEYEETDVVSKELNFSGHADMILDFSRFKPERFSIDKFPFNVEKLPDKPVVVDMKSCNTDKFNNVAQGSPHFEYLIQLMIYANILDCEYGVLIYENKNNQRLSAFKVPKQPELFEQVSMQVKSMNDMVNVIMDNGEIGHLLPPPRPMSKDSYECRYCDFKKTCHSSPVWEDPQLNEKRKQFYGDLLKED